MLKQTAKIKCRDGMVEIDISDYSLSQVAARARVKQLKSLIDAILSAESSLANLSKKEAIERRSAFEAQNFVYQYRVYEATEAALLLNRVIVGQANIAEHGFPEIGPGFIDDV